MKGIFGKLNIILVGLLAAALLWQLFCSPPPLPQELKTELDSLRSTRKTDSLRIDSLRTLGETLIRSGREDATKVSALMDSVQVLNRKIKVPGPAKPPTGSASDSSAYWESRADSMQSALATSLGISAHLTDALLIERGRSNKFEQAWLADSSALVRSEERRIKVEKTLNTLETWAKKQKPLPVWVPTLSVTAGQHYSFKQGVESTKGITVGLSWDMVRIARKVF